MLTFKSLLTKSTLGNESYWHKSAQDMSGAAGMAGMTGMAGEQPDEKQFELDFSRLAYMFLQDRAAALVPYLLGFEIVDRAEDGSRAVGIFGFKLGSDYYYVPAFFLNNQIKGMDLLFKKTTNTFMPLTEDWINYILSRSTVELGGAAPDSEKLQSDFDVPNFDFLQHPRVGPLGYHDKHAEADLYPGSRDGQWSLGTAMDALRKTAEDGIRFDDGFMDAWRGFCKAWQGKKLEKSASSELISDYLKKVGGPRASMTLLKSFGLEKKAMASALKFYNDMTAFTVDEYDKNCYQVKRAQAARPRFEVVISKEASDEPSARQLVEQGFVIKDTRPSDSKSELYADKDLAKTFGNPGTFGVYNVLLDDNSFAKAYVGNKLDGSVGVYFPENKSYVSAKSMKDVIIEGTSQGSFDDLLDSGKEAKSLASEVSDNTEDHWEVGRDKTFLLVSKDGKFVKCTPWYREKAPNRRTRVHVSGIYFDTPSWPEDMNDDFENFYRHDRYHDIDGKPRSEYDSGINCLEFSDANGTFKRYGNVLVVPADAKAIELDSKNDDHKVLGTWFSIDEGLRKAAYHKLNITSEDGSYHIRMDGGFPSAPLSLKQASVKLVTSLGIDATEASELLKKASVEPVNCFIKFAQFVGVGMNQPIDQAAGVDPYTGIPVYQTPYMDQTTGQMFGVPKLPDPDRQGFNIGSNNQITSGQNGPEMGGAGGTDVPPLDDQSMQLADQASQLGQKQVFDSAAIGGLAKVYDTSAVVDSYLPEFLQTLDRLGRIIFLYYWKHEDFTSRYGTGDTVELEDTLRSAFKQLGDLTLMLKQKAIGPEDSDNIAI